MTCFIHLCASFFWEKKNNYACRLSSSLAAKRLLVAASSVFASACNQITHYKLIKLT
jgi:hypothetical protein